MTVTATGGNQRHRVLMEETYGVAAEGDYFNMPFQAPSDLDSQQELNDDELLGQGRDPLDPSSGAIDVNGDLGVPIDVRYFGIWLAHVFGPPVTTDHTTYKQHVFTSGADTLPSFSHEIANPDIGQYFMNTGVMASKLALNLTRTGNASATISLIGQDNVSDDASGAGTPVDLTLERFSNFQATLTDGGTPMADVMSFSMTYDNGLDPDEVIGNAGKIGGIALGGASLSGSFQIRFKSVAMFDKATSRTPVDFGLGYTISGTKSLLIEAPRLLLPKPKKVVRGRGGIDATFSFKGSRDLVDGYMLRATLKNDLDGTQYGFEAP